MPCPPPDLGEKENHMARIANRKSSFPGLLFWPHGFLSVPSHVQSLLLSTVYLFQGLSTYCSQPGMCQPGFSPGCPLTHLTSTTLPQGHKVTLILYPSSLLLFQHLSQLAIVFPTKSKLYGAGGLSCLFTAVSSASK